MIDKLSQFDVVKLRSTKNVKFLSGPQGRVTDPDGDWTIVGFVDKECLIAKQSTIIKVPHIDLILVATYSKDIFIKKLQNTGKATINVSKHASEIFKKDYNDILEICALNNIPLFVESNKYLDLAIKKLASILNIEGNKDVKR
jgi:hypothetical protein